MQKIIPIGDDEQLKTFYLKLSLIILIIAVIYLIWTVINIISVYSFGFDYNWAGPSLDQWILSSIALFSICIVLVLLFILHQHMTKLKRIEREKPKPLLFKGKRLYIFTQPKGSKGGIFSKTYIKIDENKVLSLRFQMIPPKDLW